jgi:hypothetical protein
MAAEALGRRMRRPQRLLHEQGGSLFWDLLTFDRLMTNSVIHLIYWSGLGIVVLGAFGTIGAAVGVGVREGSWRGVLLAIPVLVGGLLVMTALALLWRSVCEFYVAVFKISEDLRALRLLADREDPAAAPPARRV